MKTVSTGSLAAPHNQGVTQSYRSRWTVVQGQTVILKCYPTAYTYHAPTASKVLAREVREMKAAFDTRVVIDPAHMRLKLRGGYPHALMTNSQLLMDQDLTCNSFAFIDLEPGYLVSL